MTLLDPLAGMIRALPWTPAHRYSFLCRAHSALLANSREKFIMRNFLMPTALRGAAVARMIPVHGAIATHDGETDVYCRECLRWIPATIVETELTLLDHSMRAH